MPVNGHKAGELNVSSDKLIYIIVADPAERETFSRYFEKHRFNCQTLDGLESARSAIESKAPDLFVLAGSHMPSADICKFGNFVEQHSPAAPIIALLTELQISIVSELAESENLWTAEYPISMRDIRASIDEALQKL
jgi:DNA-binding NtrC family response regulator